VALTGCLAGAGREFRRAARGTAADDGVLFRPVVGSRGAVTFRFCPFGQFPTLLARKVVRQCLAMAGEDDAALWFAHAHGMSSRRGASTTIVLYRNLEWDFALYTVLCQAFASSVLPALYLHVKSVPGVAEDGHPWATSTQPFLSNLLAQVRRRACVHLCLAGRYCDQMEGPLPGFWVDSERANVDRIFSEENWSDRIALFGQMDFRSSVLSIGSVLVTVKPPLLSLSLANYAFDEARAGPDVQSLCAWLGGDARGLLKLSLQSVGFMHGGDFCDVLEAACRCPTLTMLRLQDVESVGIMPRDPLGILFDLGAHLRHVSLNNVARTPTAMPFFAIPVPGFRHLRLRRMYLDSGGVHPLTLMLPLLPHLAHVDVSCNGLDGTALRLFARVLRERSCPLQVLKLASNIITSAYVGDLGDALAANKALLHLDLGDNFLGTAGGLRLVRDVLQRNRHLKHLDLSANQVRVVTSDLYDSLPGPAEQMPERQIVLRCNPLGPEHRKDMGRFRSHALHEFNVQFSF
jgi:hypothetical protein